MLPKLSITIRGTKLPPRKTLIESASSLLIVCVATNCVPGRTLSSAIVTVPLSYLVLPVKVLLPAIVSFPVVWTNPDPSITILPPALLTPKPLVKFTVLCVPTDAPFCWKSPTLPVAPVAPVAPFVPLVPFVPVAPVAPVAPLVPFVPLVPVAPVAPVAPFVPLVPLVPVAPVAPVAPFVPLVPFVPVAPVAPVAPVVPFVPFVPV